MLLSAALLQEVPNERKLLQYQIKESVLGAFGSDYQVSRTLPHGSPDTNGSLGGSGVREASFKGRTTSCSERLCNDPT